jgi:hypothetical protein
MKKLIKISFIISLIVFFTVTPVLSAVKYDYVTYYMLTSDNITVAWNNDNAGTILFDLSIKRVEWNEVVNTYTNIEATEYAITLPRAGLYIIMVRAKRAITTAEIALVNAMDRAALLQFIQDNNIAADVGDTTNLTDQEIKDAIIAAGKASTWSESITHGQVDGVDRGWWLYGYVAKPGPIIIGSTRELEQIDTVWIRSVWASL